MLIEPHTNDDDLRDNDRDQAYLKPEQTTIDLPDVKDIPGQEHVRPPRMREMEDITVSSADEEGDGLFDEENEMSVDEADVSETERGLLEHAADNSDSDEELERRSVLPDAKDDDGEPLNEEPDLAGEDLDVPGSEEDDSDEELGEEDEENNSYSLGGDRKD